MKPKTSAIITSSVIVVLFLIATICLLFLVSGYQINWKAKKIIKTGTISLDGMPDKVSIYLNNQLQQDSFPARFDYLLPNNYNVKILVENYQDWDKNIKVEAEKADLFENIILFKNPDKIEFILAEKSDEPNKPTTDIVIKDNQELWQNNLLLTRYSQKIGQIYRFRDDNHLILQLDNDIVALEIDSLISKKLYTLKPNEGFKGVDKQYIYISRIQDLYKGKII